MGNLFLGNLLEAKNGSFTTDTPSFTRRHRHPFCTLWSCLQQKTELIARQAFLIQMRLKS
jgi:hypothetical protein